MNYKPTIPLATSKLPRLNVELLLDYRARHRDAVMRRLWEFKALRNAPGSRILGELCFCILTPQSNAIACDKAMIEMDKRGLLSDPLSRRNELGTTIRRVRFWKNKTKYIIKAWERFASDGEDGLRDELLVQSRELEGNRELRNWLREEMRGMGVGMKEASHFLRNVGYGEGLAIIDRHILRCLQELGVMGEGDVTPRLKADYLELEERVFVFSSEVGLPLEELDLLLWSARTGYVFK